MQKAWERWIYFCDKILKPTPTDCPTFDMRELINKLKQKVGAEGVVKLINNGDAAIRITEIKIDDELQSATLLIQFSDKNVSDPVFAHLLTGDLRVESKLDGEGIAVSAHMVVSLTPRQNDKTAYLTLLEQAPGLGKSRITPFLTSEYKSFDSHFEDEDGKVRRGWPNIEILGHESQSLRESLKEGTLQGIELVQERTENKEFDEPNRIKEIKRNILLKPTKPYSGEAACGIIERVIIKAKKSKYDIIKVRYKKKKGKQKTEEINTAQADAVDMLFTKFELVTLDHSLNQCEEEIDENLEKTMKQMLQNERKKNNN